MSLSALQVAQLINLGGGLIITGLEINKLAVNPNGLTDEDFKAIIEKRNKHQAEAEAELRKILGLDPE